MIEYPIKLIEAITDLESEILTCTKAFHRVMIVTDDTIYKTYKHLFSILEANGLEIFIMASGESSKSELTLFQLLSHLAKCGFTRKDLLIALGGGVVGDLTGFAASIYMRGIQWLSVPTTLLAQVDSSVGGKTAINLPEGKNMVGSFYNPIAVFICPLFIKTLHRDELLSGIGELIKYAYLADYGMLKDIERLSESWNLNSDLPSESLSQLITEAIAIKSEVVIKDFKEEHERKYLNLGHSFGHAIESIENFKLPHGVCVAQGIWWILALEHFEASEEMKLYVNERIETYETLLERLGITKPRDYKSEELLQYILRDKKMDGKSIDLVRINCINYSEFSHVKDMDIITRIKKQCRIEKTDTDVLLANIKAISSERLRRDI